MKVTRLKAAGIHLAISAVIAAITVALILFVWYPPPLFSAVGGQLFVSLIIGIDLCLGPLLTLAVYNPSKSRFKLVFDLCVIGICQFAALVYGAHTAFESRPVYVVYAKEYFAVITADFNKEINREPVTSGKFQSLPIWGFQWAATKAPTDQTELNTIKEVRSMSGMDIHAFSKYYVDIAEARDEIRKAAQPISKLKEFNPDNVAQIDKVIEKAGKKPENVGYLDLTTPQRLMSILVDKDSGEIIRMMDLKPH